jgi:hypothetical protein
MRNGKMRRAKDKRGFYKQAIDSVPRILYAYPNDARYAKIERESRFVRCTAVCGFVCDACAGAEWNLGCRIFIN